MDENLHPKHARKLFALKNQMELLKITHGALMADLGYRPSTEKFNRLQELLKKSIPPDLEAWMKNPDQIEKNKFPDR